MAHDPSPLRFASDPDAPSALRSLVEHARGDLPDAISLGRFTAKLEASIASNVQPPAVDLTQLEAANASPTTSILVKIAGTLALVAAVGGIAAYASRDAQPGTPAMPPGVSANLPELAAPTASPPAILPALSPAIEPQAGDVEPRATPEASPERAATRQRALGRPPPSEAALLDAARAQLGRDPQHALKLTREHAARFPRGSLIQEREVIAIEALRRLGKDEAARKRGAEFGQKFPDSAHQSKIDQTLER